MASILVIGATSAIAAEVAVRRARRGDALHLVGRSAEKLAAVVARCGERATARVADLLTADPEALVREAVGILGRLDQVLVAHGDLGDQLASERSVDEAERILAVNLTSVVRLLVPIANQLEAQRGGTVAVITSVAGDRGRPRNYTYGAAKGGLNTYLQGLRSRLYPAGARVTTVRLGPVDTPMTASHAKNALFARPGLVADAIVRAMDRGAGDVYVPWFWRWILAVVRVLPEWLFQRLSFLAMR